MPRRSTAFLLLSLLLGLAVGAEAQTRAVVVQRPADVLGPRADDMRRQLREVMELYPPELARVLKLDPTLMTNAQYLAPYPALAEFLKEHPEIPRSPGYFFDFVYDQTPSPMRTAEADYNHRVV